MDTLIKELVQVDKQARLRVSKAKKRRAVALEQLEQDKARVLEENETALASFLEEQKALQAQAGEKAMRRLEADSDRVIASLDAAYAQNREAWVLTILENVTK